MYSNALRNKDVNLCCIFAVAARTMLSEESPASSGAPYRNKGLDNKNAHSPLTPASRPLFAPPPTAVSACPPATFADVNDRPPAEGAGGLVAWAVNKRARVIGHMILTDEARLDLPSPFHTRDSIRPAYGTEWEGARAALKHEARRASICARLSPWGYG